MSPSVVARIFKEFHFRSLTPKSSKNLIYKTIMNTAFETIIIVGKYDGKHTEWSINGDLEPYIPKIQQMITDYAKKVVREIQIEDAMIACEDSDDEPPPPFVKMEELNPFNWKKWAEGKSGEMEHL
jgi:hypothetical protein